VHERAAADSQSQLVRWMGVGDANTAGFVHGGTVMKLCDEVAGLAAIKHSRRPVVTAGVDRHDLSASRAHRRSGQPRLTGRAASWTNGP